MIEEGHTILTDFTVFRSWWTIDIAGGTEFPSKLSRGRGSDW
jgi:hypothetical protein